MNPYETTKYLSDEDRKQLKDELKQMLESNTKEEIDRMIEGIHKVKKMLS